MNEKQKERTLDLFLDMVRDIIHPPYVITHKPIDPDVILNRHRPIIVEGVKDDDPQD
jgi:hypothetical protein